MGRHYLSSGLLFCLLCGGCALFPRSAGSRLSVALRSESGSERREALVELKGSAGPKMRRSLERILETDTDATVRAASADVLGALALEESVEALRSSARLDAHWLVRRCSAGALVGILGREGAADVEFILTKDDDDRVRAQAVALAAEHLDLTDALRLLLKALEDKKTLVRLTARHELQALTGKPLPADYDRWRQYLLGEPALVPSP